MEQRQPKERSYPHRARAAGVGFFLSRLEFCFILTWVPLLSLNFWALQQLDLFKQANLQSKQQWKDHDQQRWAPVDPSQPERAYPKEENDKIGTPLTIPWGILSTKPQSYFELFRRDIDAVSESERCRRYGYAWNTNGAYSNGKRRRVFFGALVADEPWELMEVVATETRGVYAGIVLVESNRTQNTTPRRLQWLEHTKHVQQLFQVDHVEIRGFIQEDLKVRGLVREHQQRQEILKGWKNLGMQPGDIGLLADLDETLTRDFLRAIQVCDVPQLLHDGGSHNCHYQNVKERALSRGFESSPECTLQFAPGVKFNNKQYTDNSFSFKFPSFILGACLELIGNEALHGTAPRSPDGYRAPGYRGHSDKERYGEANKTFGPLWNGRDYRQIYGGPWKYRVPEKREFPTYTPWSGFHFHNFFATANSIRRKYRTYGHHDRLAYEKPLYELGNNLAAMVQCILMSHDPHHGNRNASSHKLFSGQQTGLLLPDQKFVPAEGGFDWFHTNVPIYFQDDDYRRRRHSFVQAIVQADRKEHGW